LPREARASLQRVAPRYAVDPLCLAATEAALGYHSRAIAVLEAARVADALSAPACKLLIDVYARLGLFARACAVAKEGLHVLDPADTRRVIAAALEHSALPAATELADALFQLTGNVEDADPTRAGDPEREALAREAAPLRDSVV
jgi:hypothetical protein